MITIFPSATAARNMALTDLVIYDEVVAIQRAILVAVQQGQYNLSVYNTAITGPIFFQESFRTPKPVQQTMFKKKDPNIYAQIQRDATQTPTPVDYWSAWMEYTQDERLKTQMESVIQYFQDAKYSIVRKTNTSTNNTFYWYIAW